MDNSHFDLALKLAPVTAMIIIMMWCCYCACTWKKTVGKNIARRNIVTPEPAIELEPPTHEEVLQIANAWARRRRRRRRRIDVNSDNAKNDTQQGETTGESNTGDSSNDNEDSATRNIQNDSGITSNLGKNSNAIIGRDQKGDDANAADDSGIKSGSGDDTIVRTSVYSIYRV